MCLTRERGAGAQQRNKKRVDGFHGRHS